MHCADKTLLLQTTQRLQTLASKVATVGYLEGFQRVIWRNAEKAFWYVTHFVPMCKDKQL